jgi:hypothetical protein
MQLADLEKGWEWSLMAVIDDTTGPSLAGCLRCNISDQLVDHNPGELAIICATGSRL